MIDGIRVDGTVTVPAGRGPHPGVVLIAGSGPTDRNWCSPLLPGTNGSGKLVAEFLSGRGYATIRYDKRASGERGPENAKKMAGKFSMKSHTDEVVHAIDAFLSEIDVNQDLIFALTNSEGAIHALNYVHGNYLPGFMGLVLTGVPGRRMPDVARMQLEASIGDFPGKPEAFMKYDRLMEEFISGKEIVQDHSLPQTMQFLLASLTNPANLPFSRELWAVDMEELISNAMVPMLLLVGKKDIQVDWVEDGTILDRIASARNDLSTFYPENANHVLKHEPASRETLDPQRVALGYNTDESSLDRDTIETIVDWLDVQSS